MAALAKAPEDRTDQEKWLVSRSRGMARSEFDNRKIFKEKLARLANNKSIYRTIQKIIKAGDEHPLFCWAVEFAADRGIGKPTQQIQAEVAMVQKLYVIEEDKV